MLDVNKDRPAVSFPHVCIEFEFYNQSVLTLLYIQPALKCLQRVAFDILLLHVVTEWLNKN